MVEVETALRASPRRWLVTGAAGFIGSHLIERLLVLGQEVVGLDNFATGSRVNIEAALAHGAQDRGGFTMVEADIRDPDACRAACADVDIVLHQAALGSVPRSIADPATTHAVNVDGFVNMLLAARDAKVSRLVFASSSSVYGDDPRLPKREGQEGRPLSPYALSKSVNEAYARVFGSMYGMQIVGLRYFNVFGARQDPEGPYAAVIPRWIANLIEGVPCDVFGDGETSRDFCYIDNVVQANLLAALAPDAAAGEVYNVAYGERTTLNELFELLQAAVAAYVPSAIAVPKMHRSPRAGDVRHSHADISLAASRLGYRPAQDVRQGLQLTVASYVRQ